MSHYNASWAPTLMPRKHFTACMRAYNHKGTASVPEAQDLHRLTAIHPVYPMSENGDYSTIDLVYVQWEDKREPEDNLREGQRDLFPGLLKAFNDEHKAGAPRKTTTIPTPRDTDLPDHIRQGRNKVPLGPALPWEVTRTVRQSVEFDPVERNPDRDIHPPRTHIIQLGTKETQEGPTANDTTAYVYHPNGRCIGTLSKACLSKLHTQYNITRTNHPQLHSQRATTFEQDVAKLLLRNQLADKESKPQDRWSCPPKMMHTLEATLGTSMERFASPMDRSGDISAYWSRCPDDQLFGANHDAYSVPWTGSSHAYPGHDLKECEKAFRWAIASAESNSEIPTCTVLVVPYAPGQPHMQHLLHPRSKIIMHIETAREDDGYRFQPPDYWQGQPGHELMDSPQLPKYTMIAVAIFNKAGKDTILTEGRISDLNVRWGRSPPTNENQWLNQTPDASYSVKSPHALEKLLHPAAAPPEIWHTPMASTADSQPLVGHRCRISLCAAPGGVYTDGSCIKSEEGIPSIGAGVHCPATGITLLINPNGKGPQTQSTEPSSAPSMWL